MSEKILAESRFRKFASVVSSFFIMLCLGGVYAWSIFANELMQEYGWNSSETQIVFGMIIFVFPTTMIFAGKLESKLNSRKMAVISALLVGGGYILSGLSEGNFVLTLLSFGILTGIGTGFGYYTALTTPVKWFTKNKGLIAGIAASGFGLAAVLLSLLTERFLNNNLSLMKVFGYVGLLYFIVIIFFSFFLFAPPQILKKTKKLQLTFLKDRNFRLLSLGIFLGTFSGLLVIGNLKNIGAEYLIENHILVLGISIFAITNFVGRIVWGAISDYFNVSFVIFFALLSQSLSIIILNFNKLNSVLYLLSTALIGFGFGANFVLFAKETAKLYGVFKLGVVYPFVFLGYALAGILGPLTGGMVFDFFGSYFGSVIIASVMSMLGAIMFLIDYIKKSSRGKI